VVPRGSRVRGWRERVIVEDAGNMDMGVARSGGGCMEWRRRW
jgi:hypothetical protein